MLKEHIALFVKAGLGSHFDEESAPADRVEPRLRLRSFELDEVELTMEAYAYNHERWWDECL